MKKKKVYKRILRCPYEKCHVKMDWMENVEAYCRRHGYRLIEGSEVKK